MRRVKGILANPGAHPWLAAFRKIIVWQRFDLQLFINFTGDLESYRPAQRWSDAKTQSMQDKYQEKLRLIMMPESLSYGTTLDVPKDLGLRSYSLREIRLHENIRKGSWISRVCNICKLRGEIFSSILNVSQNLGHSVVVGET
jgi:hypothetical protein